MKIVAPLLILATIINVSPSQVVAQEDEDTAGGTMTVTFEEPKDANLQTLAEALEESEFFSEMANGVNET